MESVSDGVGDTLDRPAPPGQFGFPPEREEYIKLLWGEAWSTSRRSHTQEEWVQWPGQSRRRHRDREKR